MIIAYVGDFGSGKTLLMTKRLYQRGQRGIRVTTNYAPTFEDAPLDGQAMEDQSEDLQDCAIGVDEMQVWLDSRSSGKGATRALTHFILQTRKRRVWLHYTTQDFGQVDVRLRRHTDYKVRCRKIRDHIFYYRVTNKRGKLVARFTLDGRRYYHLYDTRKIVRHYAPKAKS